MLCLGTEVQSLLSQLSHRPTSVRFDASVTSTPLTPVQKCFQLHGGRSVVEYNVKDATTKGQSSASQPNRHAPRTRSGCWTCRGRSVKCDGTVPLPQKPIPELISMLCKRDPPCLPQVCKGGLRPPVWYPSSVAGRVRVARCMPWAPKAQAQTCS